VGSLKICEIPRLLKETGIPGESYRPVVGYWQSLSHNVVSSTLLTQDHTTWFPHYVLWKWFEKYWGHRAFRSCFKASTIKSYISRNCRYIVLTPQSYVWLNVHTEHWTSWLNFLLGVHMQSAFELCLFRFTLHKTCSARRLSLYV
jgi:hypothetical protein